MPSENPFFHGFSLQNEAELFAQILSRQPFTVSGFSYGAILAFESALEGKRRVDRLQLISPAFFQDRTEGFKRLQLKAFKQSPSTYMQGFLANCAAPSSLDLSPYRAKGSEAQLHDLLYYTWRADRLRALLARGTRIEVYLGEEDAILNARAAADFFTPLATLYRYKGKGHILKGASCK